MYGESQRYQTQDSEQRAHGETDLSTISPIDFQKVSQPSGDRGCQKDEQEQRQNLHAAESFHHEIRCRQVMNHDDRVRFDSVDNHQSKAWRDTQEINDKEDRGRKSRDMIAYMIKDMSSAKQRCDCLDCVKSR